MNKQAKTPKKLNTPKRIVRNTKKKTKSGVRKNSSKKSRDAIQAFLVVSVLVAFSIGISSTVFFIHSKWKKLQINTGNNIEVTSTIEPATVEPQIPQPNNNSVPVQKPPEQNAISSPTVSPPVVQQPVNNVPVQINPAASPTITNPSSQNTAINVSIQKPVENMGTLVFVIDDAGNNLRELEPFLSIPFPFTIAVLPGLPYSAEAARRIRAAGKEVILHQPMEALGAQNPGPGAIYSGMSADEIRSVLKKNIEEVGPVAGMNNHQGSKITMDKQTMETILAFCAEHDLYFLDSRTTAETAAPAAALSLGMKIAERDVFIDNEQDRDSMLKYIKAGLERAQKNGKAVMIGHTWSPALAPLLGEQFRLLKNQGYTLKKASDIIK
jgi:polysaccharide deacetylase 2 family uncharacterized protein YibQ